MECQNTGVKIVEQFGMAGEKVISVPPMWGQIRTRP